MDKTIARGLCLCGCGRSTTIAKKTQASQDVKAGEPYRYLKGHQPHGTKRGAESRLWKGGRTLNSKGYYMLYRPDHPHASGTGYVYEHRLVMEQQLGRYLDPREVVHHKDGNRQNNDRSNLELLPSTGAHTQLHEDMRRAGRWAVGQDHCADCGTNERPHHSNGLCRRCYRWHSYHATHPDARDHRRQYAWSRHYPACLGCGTTNRKHFGHGLCVRCYTRKRNAQAQR